MPMLGAPPSDWDDIPSFGRSDDIQPLAGKVVAVTEFGGVLIVAFEFGVYQWTDNGLARIKFEGEK